MNDQEIPQWLIDMCYEEYRKLLKARCDSVSQLIKKLIAQKEISEMDQNNVCCVLMDGKWQKKSKMVLKYPETFHVVALIRLKQDKIN